MTQNQTSGQNESDYQSFYDGRCVLVTGGAGFIGSHLARRLVSLGAHVRIIDDLSCGRMENLEGIRDKIEFIEDSILERDALVRAIKSAQLVFHEAALASVPGSIENPNRYHRVNINGTFQVLEVAREYGIKRVVFASSSSVYGDLPSQPKHESDLPDPLSPYAMQKLTGEHLLSVWSRCFGITGISLRYFNIFGPGQSADSAYAAVVAAFAKALLTNQTPRIFGDGSATRDFTYIDNVVQANLRAGAISDSDLRARLKNRPAIFNIACGEQTSVLKLAGAMIKIMGANVEAELGPARPGDVLHSLADISLARDVLGYEPTVGLEDGLKATLDWYRSQ